VHQQAAEEIELRKFQDLDFELQYLRSQILIRKIILTSLNHFLKNIQSNKKMFVIIVNSIL